MYRTQLDILGQRIRCRIHGDIKKKLRLIREVELQFVIKWVKTRVGHNPPTTKIKINEIKMRVRRFHLMYYFINFIVLILHILSFDTVWTNLTIYKGLIAYLVKNLKMNLRESRG